MSLALLRLILVTHVEWKIIIQWNTRQRYESRKFVPQLPARALRSFIEPLFIWQKGKVFEHNLVAQRRRPEYAQLHYRNAWKLLNPDQLFGEG